MERTERLVNPSYAGRDFKLPRLGLSDAGKSPKLPRC